MDLYPSCFTHGTQKVSKLPGICIFPTNTQLYPPVWNDKWPQEKPCLKEIPNLVHIISIPDHTCVATPCDWTECQCQELLIHPFPFHLLRQKLDYSISRNIVIRCTVGCRAARHMDPFIAITTIPLDVMGRTVDTSFLAVRTTAHHNALANEHQVSKQSNYGHSKR